MAKKRYEPPPLQPRDFRSPQEIDQAIAKLRRRIPELEQLDVKSAVLNRSGADDVVRSNVRAAIREVFGENSPEYREHEYIDIWAGPYFMNMDAHQIIGAKERGRTQVIAVVQGLIGRLEEKRSDLAAGAAPTPSIYFDHLNLHPRIRDVARERFLDGHHWDAVFAAAKALINYIKERSGRDDLDGAALVRAVFSRNNPVLAFNSLSNPTELDEQEGMMHLYEGAVLAIRNPGGHSFPEGTEQRAIEYLCLLSLLAYRVQESKLRKNP
jgi:uncharacterized protein (TIGR02391 family)